MNKIINCEEATQKLKRIKEAEKELNDWLDFALNGARNPQEKEDALLNTQKLKRQFEKEMKKFQQEVFLFSVERAREAMGKENFIGPEEIQEFLPINFDEVPKIPYSVEELKKAKEQGMFLVLRMDKDREGNDLTVARLTETLQKHIKSSQSLLKLGESSKSENFFKTEVCKVQWRLVTLDPLPTSLVKNFVEQTEMLREKAKEDGVLTPDEEAECTDEFLDKIMPKYVEDSQWAQALEKAVHLKVNKRYRPTFVETFWDIAFMFLKHKSKILNRFQVLTSSRSDKGRIVGIQGISHEDGVKVDKFVYFDETAGDMGTLFSR